MTFRVWVIAVSVWMVLSGCGGGGEDDGNTCPIDCSAAADCDGFSFFVQCAPTAGGLVRDQFSYDAFGNVIVHTRSGVVYEDNGTPHQFTATLSRGEFVGSRATTCTLNVEVGGIGTCRDKVD